MTQYKLFGSSIATADGVASLDIVSDGKIYAVSWNSIGTTQAGLTTSGRLELSFASGSGFATNDTRSSISQFCYFSTAVLTAVALNFGGQQWIDLPDIPVNQGERLFLHHLVGATTPATALHTVFIYVTDKGDGSSRRVRL
jgi:hypothetical protein